MESLPRLVRLRMYIRKYGHDGLIHGIRLELPSLESFYLEDKDIVEGLTSCTIRCPLLDDLELLDCRTLKILNFEGGGALRRLKCECTTSPG